MIGILASSHTIKTDLLKEVKTDQGDRGHERIISILMKDDEIAGFSK